jgi:hypothetical protein
MTAAGSQINQFSTTSRLNALAYDSRDDTIWLAYFTGLVEKRTRTGGLLTSFTAVPEWTGLAIDTRNNTLLLLEDNDKLYEYHMNGTLVGQPIATDMIPDNGQGLAYDSSTGRLYATTQQGPGRVTIFDDASRVPEPASWMLALGALAVISRSRRRLA